MKQGWSVCAKKCGVRCFRRKPGRFAALADDFHRSCSEAFTSVNFVVDFLISQLSYFPKRFKLKNSNRTLYEVSLYLKLGETRHKQRNHGFIPLQNGATCIYSRDSRHPSDTMRPTVKAATILGPDTRSVQTDGPEGNKKNQRNDGE